MKHPGKRKRETYGRNKSRRNSGAMSSDSSLVDIVYSKIRRS